MHQAIRPGAIRVASENIAAVPLIVISARPLATACHIPCATTSGWYNGPAGRAGQPIWLAAWLKNGVFTAAGKTVLRRIRAAFELQLTAYGLAERAHRRLGAGIRRHEWQAVIGGRRTDIDDVSAPAGAHAGQRDARAVDGAVIGHVRHPLKFDLRNLGEASVDAIAGAVDPGIDRAECRRDRVCGVCESGTVGDVGLGACSQSPARFHITAGGGEAFGAPRHKPHAPATPGKQSGGAATNTG